MTGVRWQGPEAPHGLGDRPVIYSDAGPLAAYARGKAGKRRAGAVGVFNAARRSGCRLAASPQAVAETVGAVRKRTAASYRYGPGRSGDLRHADGRVNGAASGAAGILDDLNKRGFLAIMHMPDRRLGQIRAYSKMIERPGRAVPGRKDFCRHPGIDARDRPQIALAEAAGASAICTTDTAFADIVGNDAEFGHIKVQPTSAPLTGLLSGGGA